VLGTVESISKVSRDAVHRYWRKRYSGDRIVVAAAGHVDHATVVRQVRRALQPTGLLDGDAVPEQPRAGRARLSPADNVNVLRRPTEQVNLVLGTLGLPRDDERRYALGVLNNAFGGGMSSRLFQEVREKRGLVYSVYSYHSQYAETGLFGIYAGCTPKNVDAVLAICREQLDEVATTGISDAELARGKGQLKGSLVLGLEDTGSRMTRLGKGELMHGEYVSVDEIIARVDAVTPDDIRAVAADVLTRDLGLAVIGPFDDKDFSAAVA
jgi:predicted Zn-dependent peptidase